MHGRVGRRVCACMRSSARPNPIALRRVVVCEISVARLRVDPIVAIDGTPVVDIKVALSGIEPRAAITEARTLLSDIGSGSIQASCPATVLPANHQRTNRSATPIAGGPLMQARAASGSARRETDMSFRKLFGSEMTAHAALIAITLATRVTCNGNEGSQRGHGGGGGGGGSSNCPTSFFQGVGDLPNDAYDSAVSDISANGVRAVGESWTDDPTVTGDGSAGYPHGYQGIGWTNPCNGTRFFSQSTGAIGGLVALGYWLPSTHPESTAYGISPDGLTTVGFSSFGDNYVEAVTFAFGSVKQMGMLTGDVASAARDVSDTSRGQKGFMWARTWAGSWLDRPGGHKCVAVGWSSTANQHPARAGGGKAVYWGPYASPNALPLPTTLPNGKPVISAEASTVSDDAEVIAGNLFFDNGSGSFLYSAYAVTWVWNSSGGYQIKAILSGPVAGIDEDCRAVRVSGNGTVVVGYFVNASGGTSACSWSTSGGAATELSLLAGTTDAAAYGVNKNGSVIVGFCGTYTDTAPYFDHKATIWKSGTVSDIAVILSGATPPVTVPAMWELECRAVSDAGNVIGGWAYRPDPLNPSDPEAFTEEGWVAKIP